MSYLETKKLDWIFVCSFIDLDFYFVAIDAPGGFLFEWWSVFWDIFIARTNEKHSEVAASYIEVCLKILALFFHISHTFSVLSLSRVVVPRV